MGVNSAEQVLNLSRGVRDAPIRTFPRRRGKDGGYATAVHPAPLQHISYHTRLPRTTPAEAGVQGMWGTRESDRQKEVARKWTLTEE